MPALLRRMKIRRVSLVDEPASQDPQTGLGAYVSLFKSKDYKQMECPKCGEEIPEGAKKCANCGYEMKAAKEKQMDEKALKADLEAAEKLAEEEAAKREASEKRATAAEARVKELEKKLSDLENTPEAVEKRKLDALPTEVRKQLEDQAVELKKLRDREAETVFVTKARELTKINSPPEKVGALLKRAAYVMKAEDVTELETLLKAANESAKQGELLFRSMGRPSIPADSPAAKLDALVKERVTKAAGTETYADALVAVEREHPEIYREYAASVSAGRGGN